MRGCIAPPTNGPGIAVSSEPLSPLPAAFAWERFATEERKVGWDGYLSYDGVLYGLAVFAAGGRKRGAGA